MVATPLSTRVRNERAVAIIDLQGEINGSAETALRSAYALAAAGDPRSVLLNFAGVDYINSTGIALIVAILAEARRTNRRLLACGLSEHYVEIFSITRLVDYIPMFPDEQSALADTPEDA